MKTALCYKLLSLLFFYINSWHRVCRTKSITLCFLIVWFTNRKENYPKVTVGLLRCLDNGLLKGVPASLTMILGFLARNRQHWMLVIGDLLTVCCIQGFLIAVGYIVVNDCHIQLFKADECLCIDGIDGSVVECSPATRAAWVRFPVDAFLYNFYQKFHNIFLFNFFKFP